MKRLIALIGCLLTAYAACSQHVPDTLCIPLADARYKLKQADSLGVVKQELALERATTDALRADSTLQARMYFNMQQSALSFQRQKETYARLYQVGETRADSYRTEIAGLRRQVKRQKVALKITGSSAVAGIVYFVIKALL